MIHNFCISHRLVRSNCLGVNLLHTMRQVELHVPNPHTGPSFSVLINRFRPPLIRYNPYAYIPLCAFIMVWILCFHGDSLSQFFIIVSQKQLRNFEEYQDLQLKNICLYMQAVHGTYFPHFRHVSHLWQQLLIIHLGNPVRPECGKSPRSLNLCCR